jgi:hypothetical protein
MRIARRNAPCGRFSWYQNPRKLNQRHADSAELAEGENLLVTATSIILREEILLPDSGMMQQTRCDGAEG